MKLSLRNPKTQKWIIVTMVLFGMVYGYFNYVHAPREDLIVRMDAEIQKEQELLVKGKRIAANFQTVQEDYGRLMTSWEVARELLPTQKEMDGLLKSITLAGQKSDMEFLLFRPLEPVEMAYYWANPIQIRTRSNTHDLGTFLSRVAALDRIVNVSDMKMSAYRPNKGRSPDTVEAEFLATIYVFKELGAPTTTSADREEETKKKPGRRGKARATDKEEAAPAEEGSGT